MAARLCAIRARQKNHLFHPAHLDHFTLDSGQSVDPAFLATDRNWTLHGFDRASRQALFVEMPEGFDLGEEAFCYLAQFDHARRACLVPFAELPALAAAARRSPRPIFVFNIGRCGSTLISKIFANVPGVWSLSEPDVFTNLAAARHDYSPEDKHMLVQAAVVLLFRPPAGRQADAFVLKFRNGSIFDMEPVLQAVPDARAVFVWRAFEPWVNSYYKLGQLTSGAFESQATDILRRRWATLTANAPLEFYECYADLSGETGRPLDMLIAAWALSMETYLAARAGGLKLAEFSYEALIATPEATVADLLVATGLDPAHVGLAQRAYALDSQGGSPLEEVGQGVPLNESQRSYVRAQLAGHPATELMRA